MVDIVDAETRSRMMRNIRGKDTKPELLLRRGLHVRGFRYRLHHTSSPRIPREIGGTSISCSRQVGGSLSCGSASLRAKRWFRLCSTFRIG